MSWECEMGVVKAVARFLRLTVMAGLVAAVILAGLFYFDMSGQVTRNVRQAAAATLGPDVLRSVEQGSQTAARGLDQVLAPVLRGAETVWGTVTGTEAAQAAAPRMTNAWAVAESRDIMQAINVYRREHRLSPLKWDESLAAFAQERADDMITRDYFAHTDPVSEKVLLTKLRRLVTVGENLYQVSGPAVQFMRHVSENTVQGWKNSPSHNELMLMDGMRSGGIAIARTPTRIVAVLVVSG